MSYEKANNKCEICKSTGLLQGYKHPVECHEIWEYNDVTHVQKLVGLISLCVLCHKVKHIGRAMVMGAKGICYQHLSYVNQWTKAQVDIHVDEAIAVNKERSNHQWTLDLSFLSQAPYNIVINTDKERKFKITKYKKKKRNKKKTSVKITNKRPPKKR
jgi:DNA-directed RNA polymerase subunit E'/Rpb7